MQQLARLDDRDNVAIGEERQEDAGKNSLGHATQTIHILHVALQTGLRGCKSWKLRAQVFV
jgi:hypothetical protein